MALYDQVPLVPDPVEELLFRSDDLALAAHLRRQEEAAINPVLPSVSACRGSDAPRT
jgi:hypothetical protein